MPTTERTERSCLKIASELEQAKFTYERIIQETDQTLTTLNQPAVPESHEDIYKDNKVYYVRELIADLILGVGWAGGAAIALGIVSMAFPSLRGKVLISSAVIGALACVILYIRGIRYSTKKKQEHEQCNRERRAEHERQLLEDRKRLAQEAELTKHLHALTSQAATLLSETEQKLQDFYSGSPIFPKYRNFLAVTQMLEYLESGRCTAMAGPDGAYNLYETELRLNLIVSRLDEVLASLDQIQRNQYLIYEAVQNTNRLLRALNASMATVSANTAAAAAAAELSAYHTGVTNRLIKEGYC